MRTRIFQRLVALGLLALAALVVCVPSLAFGQTVTIAASSLIRKNSDGSTAGERSTLKLTDINREDCVGDRSYDIPLTLAGYDSSVNLQVWAGGSQDCSQLANRTAATQQCWRVFDGSIPRQQLVTANIKVRDIVASIKTKGDSYIGPSADSVCENKDQQTISLYFVWLKGDGSPAGTAGTVAFNVDTVGPAPPTSVTADTGDRSLSVKWTAIASQSDTDSYYIYCDDGTRGADGGLLSTKADTDAALSDASLDDAAVLSDASTTDASTDGATSSSSGSSDAGTSAAGSCTSALFETGKQAPASLKYCAKVGVGGGGVVGNLTNGVAYRIAVAAVDKYGNPGVLSNLACATPEDVIEFFESYRAAGGKGGGCHVDPSANSSATFAIGGLLALSVAALRRVRKAGKKAANS